MKILKTLQVYKIDSARRSKVDKMIISWVAELLFARSHFTKMQSS